MSEQLSPNQRQELLEQALEIYLYDEDEKNPDDAALEIVDSWLPVYNNHVRNAWIEAGCPEPSETCSFGDARDMHHAMQLGLWELAHHEIVITIGDSDTYGDAATAIRDELALTPEQRVERILAS